MREGLRLLLDAQPDFLVVGEASNNAATCRFVRDQCPDIILMDLLMPDGDSLQVLEQIRSERPTIKVVILTIHNDREWLYRALQAGADGYVLKQASSGELIEALRVIVKGENYLSPRMQTLLVQDFVKGWRPLPNNETPPHEMLSGRELEVLQRLADGQTNGEIASALVISASTVQTHRTRIMEKLALKTRTDLVKYALRHGLSELK